MLTHSYTAHWFCADLLLVVVQICSQYIEYKENKQLQKIYEGKYVHIPGCQKKWGLSYTNQENLGQSYTFLLKKWG